MNFCCWHRTVSADYGVRHVRPVTDLLEGPPFAAIVLQLLERFRSADVTWFDHFCLLRGQRHGIHRVQGGKKLRPTYAQFRSSNTFWSAWIFFFLRYRSCIAIWPPATSWSTTTNCVKWPILVSRGACGTRPERCTNSESRWFILTFIIFI